MNRTETKAQDINAADTDMRRARREGALLITETHSGLLELAYANGTYRLTAQGSVGRRPSVLAEGAARLVKPVLMQQYQVVYA